MPTLQEILDNDLGLGSEKVAGAKMAETDETTKLAMSIGLIDENIVVPLPHRKRHLGQSLGDFWRNDGFARHIIHGEVRPLDQFDADTVVSHQREALAYPTALADRPDCEREVLVHLVKAL